MIPERGRIILPDAWRWMPWRNGGGRTAEIHVEGDAAAPDWRLSLAIIERDGPFSVWPGMDRTLVWLAGGCLTLDIDGEARRLDQFGAPTEFSGEARVEAAVCRPTTVLNLMVRRGSGWQAGATPTGGTAIVHAVASATLVVGGSRLELAPQATLIARAGVEPDGGSVVMLQLSRTEPAGG